MNHLVINIPVSFTMQRYAKPLALSVSEDTYIHMN